MRDSLLGKLRLNQLMDECDTLYKITFPHQPAHAQC